MLVVRARFALVATVLAALLPSAGPASAAVRHCASKIVAVAEAPGPETNVRRQAVEAWASEARRLGEAYTSWRLAVDRSVLCEKAGQGYRCRASATPCGISNNPNQPPRGSVPPSGPNKKVLDI